MIRCRSAGSGTSQATAASGANAVALRWATRPGSAAVARRLVLLTFIWLPPGALPSPGAGTRAGVPRQPAAALADRRGRGLAGGGLGTETDLGVHVRLRGAQHEG